MRKCLFLLLLISIASCGSKKVQVSKSERKLISIKKNQNSIFENEKGIIDTVFINKGTQLSVIEERLARKFSKKIFNDTVIYASIPFEKSFTSSYNFERGKSNKEGINLSIKIIFSKNDTNDPITLKIYPFQEEYILSEVSNVEYTFTKNDDFNPDLCESSVLHCLKKIIYSSDEGIIYVEKADTGIWKLVKRI